MPWALAAASRALRFASLSWPKLRNFLLTAFFFGCANETQIAEEVSLTNARYWKRACLSRDWKLMNPSRGIKATVVAM